MGSPAPVVSMQETLTTASTTVHAAGPPPSTGSRFTTNFLAPFKSRGPNYVSNVHLMRRIIAEDAEWSLAIVPLLTDLCIQHIVKNFQSKSVLPGAGGRSQKQGGWGQPGGEALEAGS